VGMEYKSHKFEVIAAMKLCKREFCEGVGTLVVAEVQSITPVGTDPRDKHKGLLKKSIVSEVIPGNEGINIGVLPVADYGLKVEKGIGQPPQPYLEPGTMNSLSKIINVAERIYKQKMGV